MLYTATILQVIIQDNLHYLAPPVKNCVILLVQSFTACMPLITASSTFGLGRRQSSQLTTRLHCTRQYPTVYAWTNRYKNSYSIWTESFPVM